MMSVLKKLNGFREDSEAGFTLMEIIVVITIMGILSAIAIPIFVNQKGNAVDDAIKADMQTIVQTINSVRANNPNAGYIAMRSGRICASHTAFVSGQSCSPTSPKPITSSGAVFGVSSGAGTGTFYVSGYHAKANKHNSHATRLYYDSQTQVYRQV